MKKSRSAGMPGIVAGSVFVLFLAACVAGHEDESVTILRSDEGGVVLRGLIDATRTAPPERYDRIAAGRCASHGKAAEFTGMEQRATFAFDVTYRCIAPR